MLTKIIIHDSMRTFETCGVSVSAWVTIANFYCIWNYKGNTRESPRFDTVAAPGLKEKVIPIESNGKFKLQKYSGLIHYLIPLPAGVPSVVFFAGIFLSNPQEIGKKQKAVFRNDKKEKINYIE